MVSQTLNCSVSYSFYLFYNSTQSLITFIYKSHNFNFKLSSRCIFTKNPYPGVGGGGGGVGWCDGAR